MLGPGGAGVSVVAAAAALRDDTAFPPAGLRLGAERGTLLVSLDARSYLPDRLGVLRVPGEPVAVTAGTDLLQLDPLTILEGAWADFTAALTAVTGGRSFLPIVGTLASVAPGEIATLPGAQEFLLLRQIRAAATAGRWRRVVVDLSGCGDPFSLLRAPTVLSSALERLWPRHARLAEAAEKPAMAQLSAAVEGIDRDCQDLIELFSDPHGVAAHLVIDAGDRGTRCLPDQIASSDLMALPVRSVVVNSGAGGPPRADLGDVLDALTSDDDSVEVLSVPAAPEPVDRLSRLRRVTVDLPCPTGRPRGSGALTVTHVAGEDLDSVFELAWKQGLPDPDRLALGRSGDDLLVTVSGFRYPVRLPSVLRRCVVTDADWRDGRLVLRFRPDATVWPQRPMRPASD
ncbi:chromosome partitioning ATPase [Gordonia neofelifaecis NRRL B-59395]|uniref:Chromosome partitioning ATPase n=1 Tax=Gordonia neofelifaecis NRRL B-59395 TaxID=644548 RepID=F1YHJ6_9ACTN|nr:chromosome partitioning ATPase [Gordonia neofelifaecis NRRL B-59395]